MTVGWHSFELRPKGSPPIPAAYRAHIEATRPQFEAMAQQQYGITIKSGPFGIDSRPALIGAKYAEAQRKGDAYHEAVFRAYWEQARDISELTVLQMTAEAVGLDGDSFIAALTNPSYEQAVNRDIMQANQYGLSGVPALVFANKYLVSGAQPYEVLVEVVEKIGQ